MKSSDAEMLRLLEAANPIASEDVKGWAYQELGRQLLSEIIGSTPGPELPRKPWIKPPMRMVIAALLASLGLWLAVAWIPDRAEVVTNPPATDGATLETIARIASEQELPDSATTGYRYTKTREVGAQLIGGESPYTVLLSRIRESWIGPDGSGRSRSEPGDVEFPSQKDRTAWEAAGSPDLTAGNVEEQTYSTGELSYEDHARLPTDPDQLFSEIKKRAGTAGPGLNPEMFIVIGDLLRGTNLPPDLRAALFRAAGRIPGIKVVENETDPVGRSGVAMSLIYDDQNGSLLQVERIFDRESTLLLAEKQIIVDKTSMPSEFRSLPPGAPSSSRPALGPPTLSAPPGTVMSSIAYLSSGTVSSPQDRPENVQHR